MESIQVFILAAGSSKRLGHPKQLVRYNKKYLINHAIDLALGASCKNIKVVLGSNAQLIKKEIISNQVEIIINQNWSEGMSSSFKKAIETIDSNRSEAALFLLCDQPLLSSIVIKDIIEKHKANKNKIVTCNYGDVSGPPTLFPSRFFNSLRKLEGVEGGKIIIASNLNDVIWIDFPDGKKDLNTQDDLEYFDSLSE